MNSNWKRADRLMKFITSAVDLILRNRYEVRKNPLYIELGTEVGPGAARTTEEIKRMLGKLFHKAEYYPPETAAAFSALTKEHTQDRLAAFLKRFVDVPVEARLALLELKEASWEEILIWIDSYIASRGSYLERKIAEPIVEQREGFSSPGLGEMEHQFDIGSRNLFSLYTVRKYAAEFRDILPSMVERAESLRLISVSKNVPDYVRRYLEEASRCYIHGNFLASVLLCRSAIEAAAEDRLKKKGFARELRAIGKERLKSILSLALEKGLMDKIFWMAADDIRKQANKAAHPQEVPGECECKRGFDETRRILQHLYE